MKRGIKTTACLLCLVLMAGLLAGCSDSGTGKANGKAAATEAPAKRSDITVFVVNGNYSEGAEKDSVWKYIEDKANVNLEITGQVHGDDYYTVLAPIVNTVTDIPDIIFTADGMNGAFANWSDQATGVLYDFRNLLLGKEEQYPHLSKLINSDAYKNLTTEGAYTQLPQLSDACGWGIYYRADWLVKIGYTQTDENGNVVARTPVNMDEFQDVMMKFSDPSYELNPGKQTYGLSPLAAEHGLNPIQHAFGTQAPGSSNYITADNKIEKAMLSKEYKNYLEWVHMCYENGWIDPQYYNNNTDTRMVEVFSNGQCGIMIINAGQHVIWKAKPMEDIWGKGTCVMGPPPIGTANVGKEGAGGWSNWGGSWGGFSITRSCKDVDAALRLLDYLYSWEGGLTSRYGIEGIHWNWNEDKTRIIPNLDNRALEPSGAFATAKGEDGELNYYGTYRFANHLLGVPIKWDKFETTGQISFFTDYYAIDPEYAHLMVQADQWYDMLVTSNLLNFSCLTSSQSKKNSNVNDLCRTYAAQAITGEKNLTTDYDALVAACEEQGLQEVYDAVAQAAKIAGLMK